MATVTITIETDNAAFEENPCELLDILTKLGRKAVHYPVNDLDGEVLRDSNGNTVGRVTVEK